MSDILMGYTVYVMGCMPYIVICSKATLYSTDDIQDSVDGENINGIVCWCVRNCHIH